MLFNSKLLVGILFIILASRKALAVERQINFPSDFQFGTATSSYQIEGAWDTDGKGPSIWDTFTHDNPEKISDRSNGDVATKSYELYKEDVAALKSVGAHFYRFSISWPRVLQNGDISTKNQAGIDYYHKLIDELIENDIEPVITIYHWDLPQSIQDLGGFTNPYIVEYFEQYADLLFTEYGPKVKLWITLNEPKMYCQQGYAKGSWAPGIKLNGVGDYYCAHYSILAHARMYHLYKNKYFAAQGGKIGITLNTDFYYPLDPDSVEDKEAAERAIQFSFGLYAHPILSINGDYPDVVRNRINDNSEAQGYKRSRLPVFTSSEIEYIRGTSDFLGLNYYSSSMATTADDSYYAIPSVEHDTHVLTSKDQSWPREGWISNVPIGLFNLLQWIRDEYNNVEVIITENGTSDSGGLNDAFRLSYLQGHLAAVSDAIADGCKVTAHTTWSLIDNFEWASGYTVKFGIFEVDNDFSRVEKSSVAFLREVFRDRSFVFDE